MTVTYEARRRSLIHASRRLQRQLDHLKMTSARLSWARIWVFLGALALAFFATSISEQLGLITLILGLVVFGVVVRLHRRVEAQTRQFQIWLHIKQTLLARQALDWPRIPPALPVAASPKHPFEIDLDLMGDYSVHQLLDTTVTVEGSTKLRNWLLQEVPDYQQILERQNLVRELIPQTSFRHKLALFGAGPTSKRWSASVLTQWLATPNPDDRLGLVVAILGGLSAITIMLWLLNAVSGIGPFWVISFLVYFVLTISQVRNLGWLFEEANRLQDSLEPVKAALTFLETYRCPTPHLSRLCQLFKSANKPSATLRELGRIISGASLQNNILVWLLLNALVPWDLFFAHQLRRVKRRLQAQLPTWLDTRFELEALCALANFAYVNPDYVFPRLEAEMVTWQGQDLGHPLIPREKRVTNDFSMDGLGQLVLITGSNMSGKSTFLRSVGVNMALAYAGSVVPAATLHLSLFRMFTCIRINDSVTEGVSYFYAEVHRLKALLVALNDEHPLPLFFLIDEIFRGTNNRERFIGSQAYLRELVRSKNGMGIVSTHDLELTRLTEDNVQNYHFADSIQNNHLVFDYRLRPGPSTTTNALKLMQMEGLPVPSSGEN
jgi:hypothetical protein